VLRSDRLADQDSEHQTSAGNWKAADFQSEAYVALGTLSKGNAPQIAA
jgi:hypothetical protein